MELVDKTVVLRKLSGLDTYLKQMREFAGMTIQVYNADWRTQRIVERTLQMMIETCADIANHIVSDRGMRAPTGYADTFSVLMENAVINPELSMIMEKMAKFRNVVVHQYEGVDAEIVIAILAKHLNDFDRFRGAILSYLNKPAS
ncbi:MAG: hypothetical protein QG578_1686 [Thermodesulfobacteriota bacterium]|nr:hypothetical protein [Thermodesulfobacteriota bacterium]